ncbi:MULTISPECIES: nucleoside deaminase [Brucella]|uniref:Cytidine and deoxycytidylate deaminase zinc-binding region family protein n=1 Tax=Brucella lupini TaxID=255457 RepID=A0A256GVV4_9HYPH|nr:MULTISPECIES: nucleoside deaminase [Brucella]RNL43792.1 nucleoside deaminase [Ochrobactrum sp. MH181795]KAB2702436.1 nucleoside deaminase [Brucella lupini]KAB2729094.1 nucleoside deaminase [Brucella anthropi]KAB2746266.1 nucleoside deaminase [Brucella anthropi]KAB2801045.1 nucleoside deaminase [Brucella anthropi]
MSNDRTYLDQAIRLAFDNVEQGGRPFGAVVVKGGKVIATGVNRMQADCDPTAHAEMLALRAAGKTLQSPRLDGCEVYASGQPCPMCFAAMRMAGIEKIRFAYSNEQAEPFGLSTAKIAAELAKPLGAQTSISFEHSPPENDPDLYQVWESKKKTGA